MSTSKRILALALSLTWLNSFSQQATTTVHGDYAVTVLKPTGPQPRWASMSGIKNAKWVDHTYKWYFNPDNVPSYLTVDEVLEAMKAAAAQWMQVSNISIQYMGITSVAPETFVPNTNGGSDYDQVSVWGFKVLGVEIKNVSAYASTAIYYSGQMIDADIVLNANRGDWGLASLQSTITHEIGHAIGIAHSEEPSSIMFANPYHSSPDYGQWLRSDDVAAVKALYGVSKDALANQIMNWAENTFKGAFLNMEKKRPGYKSYSRPPATSNGNGFLFRYYPDSKSYLGAMDGYMYYIESGKNPQPVGKVVDFMSAVAESRF